MDRKGLLRLRASGSRLAMACGPECQRGGRQSGEGFECLPRPAGEGCWIDNERAGYRPYSAGQGIQEAGKSEVGEGGCVARGKLGHPMMPQRKGEPGVKHDAPSCVRLRQQLFGSFVRQQPPIANGRTESPEVAALGEAPLAVGPRLSLDDLCSGLAKELGDGQVELWRQPLHLLVR